MYNEVININLSTLKTFETENTLEKDNFAPVKKIDSKNQANNNKKNLSKSKIINKEAKIKNISSFKEQKEEEENIKNNYQIEKNFEDIESKTVSQQQNLKKKNTSANTIADENRNIFNNYNDELKALIQRNATQNYPRISLRKKEEGIVELNFSIDINGNILNITAGKKTNAPQRLITASINTLKLISPYKKNPILKKKILFLLLSYIN
tara:strand:- start:2054 stop:2680 length:627 start_codon:yes stop_codon:yes gene_type:complete